MDRELRPPLLWAASAGSTDALLALVRYGANSNNIDKDGLAAIHCAASRGHTGSLAKLWQRFIELALTNCNPSALSHNILLPHQ